MDHIPKVPNTRASPLNASPTHRQGPSLVAHLGALLPSSGSPAAAAHSAGADAPDLDIGAALMFGRFAGGSIGAPIPMVGGTSMDSAGRFRPPPGGPQPPGGLPCGMPIGGGTMHPPALSGGMPNGGGGVTPKGVARGAPMGRGGGTPISAGLPEPHAPPPAFTCLACFLSRSTSRMRMSFFLKLVSFGRVSGSTARAKPFPFADVPPLSTLNVTMSPTLAPEVRKVLPLT